MILQNLASCNYCHDFDGKVSFDKPYLRYEVEQKWKPKNVDVLFIAGSPPWSEDRYFYKEDMTGRKTNLQKEVLSYLNLNSLQDFKANNFFLIDAIKCRLNKTAGNEEVPDKVIINCCEKFLVRNYVNLDQKQSLY